MDIRTLVDDFAGNVARLVDTQATERARQLVATAFGSPGGGRLPALAQAHPRHRKRPPVQLCPVPRCTNRAAPVFGMVCAKHKDLPKRKIKAFREARRAAKAKSKG